MMIPLQLCKDWENPAVCARGRAPEHSAWGAYETFAQAAVCDRTMSRWVMNLNGTYAFRLLGNPEDAGGFYETDYDDSAFAPIQVPGSWELQGHGKPIYTNIPYPWPLAEGASGALKAGADGPLLYNPPELPERNPTGCYRKPFVLPADYAGRDIFLRMEGVETAYCLWVNGQSVGYAEDGRLASEFDITPYVQEGANLLAVQVMRFASCSWIEDQDNWYLSGIHRGVSIIAKPRLRVQDWQITATPCLPGRGGLLCMDIQASRVAGFADCVAKVTLLNEAGQTEGTWEASFAAEGSYALADGPVSGWARIEAALSEVSLWSPDSPVLYTAVITLQDANGHILDIESARFGFRKVEVANGIVQFNGRRLVVCGVNRHEHGPLGRTTDKADLREELALMKGLHINAVRTSHAPACQEFYDLCDEMGLLVVCESNVETHGLAALLSADPSWSAAYLERARRMARIYRNHTCIYAWSLGNESGHGANHGAMAGFLREYDKTRLVQYESAFPGPNLSDIRGLMYAPVAKIHDMLCDIEDTRPIILVEFLYQIANSGGGAEIFRQLTDSYPRFQGGFVWDWADKTLPAKQNGQTFDGYGGDFGEDITNGVPFMVANGILHADLTPKPVAYDVRQVFAPLRIGRRDGVHTWSTKYNWNRYVFQNKSFAIREGYSATATLIEDGRDLQTVPVTLPRVLPGQEAEFDFEIPHTKQPGREYAITFHLYHQSELAFCVQFPLERGAGECAAQDNPKASPAITYNSATGAITLSVDGKAVLQGGLPCYSRPLTGLDCAPDWGWVEETAPMADARPVLVKESVTASETETCITLDFGIETAFARELTARVCYRVTNACVEVEFTSTAAGGWRALPRVGLAFTLPKALDALTYYGFGPRECYSDRMASARLGVYQNTVLAEHVPYVPPSENGGHEKTRWLTLAGGDGQGIRIAGASPFHFDVRANTLADYRAAKHEHELPKGGDITLHLDAAHSPIGGHMAWSTDVDAREMLGDGLYALRFTIFLS